MQTGHDNSLNESRKWEIMQLYLKVLEMVLKHTEKKTKNKDFSESLTNKKLHKGLYVCCVETVYFVMNLKLLDFETLMMEAGVEPLHMWRVLYTFMRFDPSMPTPLKKNFLDLEISILSYYAWSDELTVTSFVSSINQDKDNDLSPLIKTKKNEVIMPEFKFFYRVLRQAATQMYHLASGLRLKEEVIEEIWSLIKFVFTEKLYILHFRHMDQIIFCSIYVICKIFKHNIKFQEIINK